MRSRIGILTLASFLLVATSLLSVSVYASDADGLWMPNVTRIYITNNYTVGGNTYAKGGDTITINATVGNMNLTAAAGQYNVTAKIYSTTALLGTIKLLNTTPGINASVFWTGTYAVPSVSIAGGSVANITINATYVNGTADVNTNITQKVTWGVDATSPSVSVTCADNSGSQVSCPTSQTWRAISGNSKKICWTATDAVGVAASSGTITFSSVPSGSAIATTTNATGGSTSIQYCYVFTPDVLGSYAISFTPADNVTNSGTASTHTISYALPEDASDLVVAQQTQTQTVTGSNGLGGYDIPSSGDVWSYLVSGFQSVWNMLFGWLQ